MNLKFWQKKESPVEYKDAAQATTISSKNVSDLMKVQTQWRSFEYNLSQYQQYNPSPLVIQKTMNIFDDMYMKDEQINACYNIKTKMILSNGFNIVVQDQEDPKQQEIKDFLWYALNDGYNGLFMEDLKQIISAIKYGFSLTEKVFKVFNAGPYKGKIGINHLLTRPPHSFEFEQDDNGEIEKIVQYTQTGQIEVDRRKVLIYTFDKQFQSPYGISDFTCIYQTYFMKLMLKRYMAIYSERSAIPPIFATYPQNLSDAEKINLSNMLNNLQAKSTGRFQDGIEVKALDMDKSASTDLFVKYFDKYDSIISRGLLLPELLGFTQHDSGSQSLGIEQFDLFLNTAVFPEQAIIEEIQNEELIKELVILNFGEQEYYPRFEFNKPETKDKLEMYKVWLDAVQKGAVKSTIEDENVMRNDFGFSDREEDEEDLENEPTDTEPQKTEYDKQVEPKDIEDEGDKKKEFLEIDDDIKYRRKLTEFEEKNADIDNTVESFEKLELKFANNLSETVNDIRFYIEKKVINEKIVVNKDFKAVNNLQLKSKQQKQITYVFGKGLEDGFNQGIKDTRVNIKKGVKSAPSEFKEQMLEMADQLQYTVGSLKPKEAISYIKSRKITLAGTEEEFILKNTKLIIEGGITNGKGESQVISELETFFDKYNVYQYTGTGEIKNINDIKGRLTSVVRTTTTDAYNKGLFQSYNDPNVKSIIGALQYSAIIDDATTDFCASYDGRIFSANDSEWDSINPPNHFSCRSTTIPVFTFDSYTVSNKIAVQPAIGFGGQV